MVHALREIRRVLKPDGILIDIRPMMDRWRVGVTSARESRETGRVQDFAAGLADDAAANRAITQAAENGWFSSDRQEFFSYSYSWDTPGEMEEWIDTEWEDFVALNEEAKRTTRAAWAIGDADTRVRLKIKMLIAKWNVRKDS
jgi:SAM-dependent methyltransferase